MHAGHDLPEIFLARIRNPGGPYRVDDPIAIAYAAPNVGRLVALDAAARERCAHYERTAIPEIVSAIVEHAVAPYAAGDTLTLYFVDPAIARIRRDTAEPQTNFDRSEDFRVTQRLEEKVADRGTDGREPEAHERDAGEHTSHGFFPNEVTPNGGFAVAHTPDSLVATGPKVDEITEHANRAFAPTANLASAPPPDPPTADAETRIIVCLEWSAERVRRFIQVVDRLFTIDRLGWYRHALAMRLLIPDEIRSGDELADVEAMRHLHALRAAAVTALGKPLLAACMPGFTVTSDWLETLESSREARAIAGLRDALLPCATDHAENTNDRLRTDDAASTVGAIYRRALLADGATSVESFLPILIPTQAHDAALSSRLTDYRNLLVELFAQTARATDPVRLGTLAQPNHSLDDRLWQLVGAVGEAFGGFVHA